MTDRERIGFGGEHNDRHIGKFPNHAAGGQAIHFRHHHIQHHQIGVLLLYQRDSLCAGGAGDNLVAFILQIKADAFYQQRFIVHNQYFHDVPPVVT